MFAHHLALKMGFNSWKLAVLAFAFFFKFTEINFQVTAIYCTCKASDSGYIAVINAVTDPLNSKQLIVQAALGGKMDMKVAVSVKLLRTLLLIFCTSRWF